jgi:hypothetical protein
MALISERAIPKNIYPQESVAVRDIKPISTTRKTTLQTSERKLSMESLM